MKKRNEGGGQKKNYFQGSWNNFFASFTASATELQCNVMFLFSSPQPEAFNLETLNQFHL